MLVETRILTPHFLPFLPIASFSKFSYCVKSGFSRREPTGNISKSTYLYVFTYIFVIEIGSVGFGGGKVPGSASWGNKLADMVVIQSKSKVVRTRGVSDVSLIP